MYVDLLQYLQDLETRLGRDSETYRAAAMAYSQFPNLRAYLDHLGVVRLCSVDVNAYVDYMDITHRTEEGGSLEILPFLKDHGGRVYADPPLYVVGHRNTNGFGEVPLVDWKELLTDAGISTEIIRKVGHYLGSHAAVNYDELPD